MKMQKRINRYPKTANMSNNTHRRIKELLEQKQETSERKIVVNDILKDLLADHERNHDPMYFSIRQHNEEWKGILAEFDQLIEDLPNDDLDDMFPNLMEFRKKLEEKYTK